MKKACLLFIGLGFLISTEAQVEFSGGLLGTGSIWETPTNWVGNILPGNRVDVEIPVRALPHAVTISSLVVVNNLNLNGNTLNVEGLGRLVVYGTLTLGVMSTLTTNSPVVLKDGSSIIQGDSSAIIGDVNFQRNGNTNDRVYNYWSSPVADETFRDVYLSFLGPDVDSNDMYSFDDTAQNDDTTGNNTGWTLVDPNDTLKLAMGYAITPIEGDNGTPTRSFIGEAYNGDLNLDINIDALADGSYYVLTGNPYPSSIDLDVFLIDNALIGEVYLWDDADGENFRADYIVANSLGASGGNSGLTDVDYIGACQGFFVDAGSLGLGSGIIQFNNTMRVGGNNSQFFRVNSNERLYLNIQSLDAKYGSQTLIGFHPDGTSGKDLNLDSKKLGDNPNVSLYSFMKGQEDDHFAIQAYSTLPAYYTIPLGLELGVSELLEFTLESVNIDLGTQVYLKDKQEDKVTDLLVEGYQVMLAEGVYEDRFELLVEKSNGIGIQSFSNNQLVYAYEGGIYLVSEINEQFNFLLFDALGRVVKSKSNFSSGQRIDVNELPAGVYFVKLLSQSGSEEQITKIVLR